MTSPGPAAGVTDGVEPPPRTATPPRRTLRSAALLVLSALVITAATINLTRTRLEVQDWDCPPQPHSCARPVVVGGWPLPFVSDFHGISPVNSVSWSGALLREDHFHAGAFAADAAFWLALIAGARALGRRWRQRRPDPAPGV